MKRVGLDIGGTKIECAVLDGDGHVLARERVPTERDNGYKHILGQISKLYKKLSDQLSDEFLFGVCVPGPLTAEGDRLKHGNTQALVGEPLKDDIESIFGATPVLDNDANCFAQAEASLGAGKGSKVVFGVILGTGVGGGAFPSMAVLTTEDSISLANGDTPSSILAGNRAIVESRGA